MFCAPKSPSACAETACGMQNSAVIKIPITMMTASAVWILCSIRRANMNSRPTPASALTDTRISPMSIRLPETV